MTHCLSEATARCEFETRLASSRSTVYVRDLKRVGVNGSKLYLRKEPVRFGAIRFGSGLFENSSVRFGSVRQFMLPGSMRFGLRFSDPSWFGPVRFGSVPRPVPAGSGMKRFGCSAGSVWFLIPSCYFHQPHHAVVTAEPRGLTTNHDGVPAKAYSGIRSVFKISYLFLRPRLWQFEI